MCEGCSRRCSASRLQHDAKNATLLNNGEVLVAGGRARMPLSLLPPATSTLPLLSNVAVWLERAVVMLPVRVNVPVVGSYNSLVAIGMPLPLPLPPATSTLPLLSNVAV